MVRIPGTTSSSPDDRAAGSQIELARGFAVDAHGAQKYGAEPYVVHLDAVAATARELGFTDETVSLVAFLHDVLEDTDASADDIEAKFGARVRRAVEQLTSRPDQRDPFAAMNELAFAVKLADRISNVRAIGRDSSDHDDHERLLAKYRTQLAPIASRAITLGGAHRRALDVLRRDLLNASERVLLRHPRVPQPEYYVVGARPVKAVPTADGGLDVLAWDWDRATFVRDMSYLPRISFPEGEVEVVSEGRFEEYLDELRKGDVTMGRRNDGAT